MTPRPPRRTYRRPPLLEAVVEFQFELPVGGWKSVFLGKIHSLIEADFPRVEPLVGTKIEFKQGGGRVEVASAPEANRFLQEEGGEVVTVGPGVLGFSVLPFKRPGGHPGWDLLRDRALELLEGYRKIVNPGWLRRVGVRYINAIPVTPGEFRLDAIVTSESGLVPAVLLGEENPFSFRLERILSADAKGRHAEVIQLSAQPVGQDSAHLMLDVDQVWTPTTSGEFEEPDTVLEDLHNAVHDVFSTIIRPEVLESFGPASLNEE